MTERPIKEGDLAIVAPQHHWAGVIVTVEEVKSWGIVAYAFFPIPRTNRTGQAFIRLGTTEFYKLKCPHCEMNQKKHYELGAPPDQEGADAKEKNRD